MLSLPVCAAVMVDDMSGSSDNAARTMIGAMYIEEKGCFDIIVHPEKY